MDQDQGQPPAYQPPEATSGGPISEAWGTGAPGASELERASTMPAPPYGPYPPYPPNPPYPMAPGQMGGYGPPSGYYPMWGGYPPYGAPVSTIPLAPAKRRSPLKWILLASAVAVLLVASGIGGVLTVRQLRPGFLLPTTKSPATTAHATGTSTPLGYFDFKDALTSNVNGWSDDTYCSFHDAAYHVNPGTTYTGYNCYAPAGVFSDFDIHVTVVETSGPLTDGYGLIFRRTDSQNYYHFAVNAEGYAWVSKMVNGQRDYISPNWQPPTFARGLGQSNTLRLVAHGSSITCYVNGVEIGTVTDSSFARGRVGVFSGDTNLDAAFSNFEVAGVP